MDTGSQLVDFIKHHHAATRPCFLQSLNDVARQSPYVGTAMAPDFCLIVHPSQGDAHKLAP